MTIDELDKRLDVLKENADLRRNAKYYFSHELAEKMSRESAERHTFHLHSLLLEIAHAIATGLVADPKALCLAFESGLRERGL